MHCCCSPLGRGRRPCCRVQILGSSGQQLGDKIEDDEQARFGMGECEVNIDQVGEKDDMMQDDGADIGQRHNAWFRGGREKPWMMPTSCSLASTCPVWVALQATRRHVRSTPKGDACTTSR